MAVRIDANVVDLGSALSDSCGIPHASGIEALGAGSITATNNTIQAGYGPGVDSAIGDFNDYSDSTSGNVTYTVTNNVLWAPNTGGGSNYCVRLQGSSSFASATNAGLDNNDLFDCAGGLLVTPNGALSDVGTINGNSVFAATGNISYDLLTGGFFSDPTAHNWRLVSGSSGDVDLENVKQGGLVLIAAGRRDFDDAVRPQGIVGSTGWSMGAFQQNN